jgi:predicted MPP superfamily phosphohydrolase
VVTPFVGPPHLPPLGRKYHIGRYQVGSMIQYTNRGLGMVGLPIRFGSRPEITVITLHAA